MSSLLQVVEVVLVPVSFLLETDVAVGFHAVAVFKEQDEPFDDVPDEEGQVEQLLLLGGMYQLVVEFCRVERPDGKDKAAQADCQEVLSDEKPPDDENLMPPCRHLP